MINIFDKNFENILQKEMEISDSQNLNETVGKNKLLILYVNIRSLNENFNKLEVFVDNLKNKPSVIVCAETWTLFNTEIFKLSGYKIYYNDSKINKADGTVIYINENIIQNTQKIAIGRLKFLVSDLKTKNETLRISAIYRSHDISKTEFILSFKKYLLENKNLRNHCIVGDFNINILYKNTQTYENTIGQEFLNNLLEYEYLPCFLGVTRPGTDGQGGTCIDNIYLKTNNMSAKAYKLINPFNDHYPLFVELDNVELIQKKNTTNKIIIYKKLKNFANNIEWNTILSIQDPNYAINELIKKIHICAGKATVEKKKIRNKEKVPRNEWITKAIIVSCNKKEMLYKLWKNNKNCNNLKKEYIEYTKILNRVIKDAKIKYERNRISKNCNDPKKLWEIINEKMGKTKRKSDNTINSINDNGKKILGDSNIASCMNKYFCEIGKNLSEKLRNCNEKSKSIINNPKSIFINPTNSKEINKVIKELKDKAGGEDQINAKILKELVTYISIPLVHIFNLSIEKSVWPEALKSAIVIPIHKQGDKTNISNYRPISLISNIAKIFERIIYNRLISFFEDCNILSENQFGFIKKRH